MSPVDFDLEFDEIYVMKIKEETPTPPDNPPSDNPLEDDLIIFDADVPLKGVDDTLIIF